MNLQPLEDRIVVRGLQVDGHRVADHCLDDAEDAPADQGIAHQRSSKHPEACPGPNDASKLFDQFEDIVRGELNAKKK